ncbi:hypothetical protein BOTBODRAFT_152505 [Botryobasidium botryosum FD-172 SS1]|uniref:Peroxisomal biogenesis factor 11 n=1 Tax=Botryobasidium botryosum (strain FD-172 SS1) TaxID=930990 RepID=A0A067N732_BOTB1|nr:hypothetical protein BOTBODRAFT_152505 [Botryobasidium botryosum FD-172 SS1]
MSEIAAQVILHPAVSQILRVWATTLGRDKTYRAIQYFARFYAWLLISRGRKLDAARWNALKASLASGRKLMRLFKPMENLQAALRAAQPDLVQARALEQTSLIARQLATAAYLSYDGISWANSVRFLSMAPDRANRFNKLSQRFWLAGIFFGIINGTFKLRRIASEGRKLRAHYGEKDADGEAERRLNLKALYVEAGSVKYQLVQDLLDIWLPASNLGLVNLSDGTAGVIGFITSIMALRLQWNAARAK